MVQARPWIIIGGGGHASVVADTLLGLGAEVLGFTDPSGASADRLEMPHLGGDDALASNPPGSVTLAMGIGSVSRPARRAELFRRLRSLGYEFPPIVHPSAVVARSVGIGAGVQVMAGAVLQSNCVLGENTLINTCASVDHDCVIEANVHVAPGATVSGGVTIGSEAHIGAGATIIQGRRVGSASIVGAGAVVVRDVAPGDTVIGVPAKTRES
jgi:sugar O-acyltransferase (sialic acid O-acetyltransferase NeuD family)